MKNAGLPLEVIRAQICYEPTPWRSVQIIGVPKSSGQRRGIDSDLEQALGDPRAVAPASPYVECYSGPSVRPLERPTFWQDVRQLGFAFRANDWPAVRAFYYQNGPLGNPWDSDEDPWAYSSAWLEWFRHVSVLVTALKEGRTTQLEGYFPGPGIHRWDPPWREELPILGWDAYRLRFAGGLKGEALTTMVWQEVIESVTEELSRIGLNVVLQDYRQQRSASVLWGFRPVGALQAAFLQWFFQEVTQVSLTKCAGCSSYVPPERTVYCSDTCRMRVKKTRDRQRIRLIDDLNHTGKSPREIVRAVRQQIGVQTTEASVIRRVEKTSRQVT